MKKIVIKYLFLITLLGAGTTAIAQNLSVIPVPVTTALSPQNKFFTLDYKLDLEYFDETHKNEIGFYAEWIEKFCNLKVRSYYYNPKELVERINTPSINLYLNSEKIKEKDGYEIRIEDNSIRITANNKAGIFHGINSAIQLINNAKAFGNKIPFGTIYDYPRFGWRGMHLDVSRHFFDVTFIKKYIDFLALHKMNVFHWHLTDDQGWRIEIKKYPKLTSVGGYRNGSMIGAYSDQKFDTFRYGGFYSQNEIREIVNYASQRQITIVPEIEMPGHSMAAIAAYPELSCTGGTFEVAKGWGVFEDVYCAGKDETFLFMQNVLDEVLQMFPGEYIHIGGDECPKERWKKCSKCQERISTLKLKDEHELQSYFIQRIEKYVNSKGRKIIGWDEILEGGLAPNAAVMSWRGTDGGTEAARLHHPVVMTPGTHCYFDHYQGIPQYEPHAIGGYTTVQKVHSFEPIPETLKDDEKKWIMGAQGNVWTEYMTTSDHVEYMATTRLCALAEVLWSPYKARTTEQFVTQLTNYLQHLNNFGYKTSTSFLQPKLKISKGENGILLNLSSPGVKGKLSYCWYNNLDETSKESNKTIEIKKNDTSLLVATNYLMVDFIPEANPKLVQRFYYSFERNKAMGKPVAFASPPSQHYNTDQEITLVNGVHAQWPRVNTEWNAWSGQNAEITVDLNKTEKINTITIGYLKDEDNWIYPPKNITVYYSNNGKKFKALKKAKQKTSNDYIKLEWNDKGAYETKVESEKINHFALSKKIKGRYVKFVLENPGKIPAGKPGAGNDAWLFVDEITIH